MLRGYFRRYYKTKQHTYPKHIMIQKNRFLTGIKKKRDLATSFSTKIK